MSGLAFAQAPVPSHPLRFLLAALAWGVVAGVWLALHGRHALASRWTPEALVLVHMLALGLLGNAMLGSLVQFLPVAAGSPLPGARAMPVLHLAFNFGIALLLAALARPAPVPALMAAAVLAAVLGTFALLALLAVAHGSGERAARLGIAAALAALLATLALGVRLLAARVGWIEAPAMRLVDLHAATGILGWIIGLLVAVGGIAMPVLQGTRPWPMHAVAGWWAVLGMALAGAAGAAAAMVPDDAWRGLLLPAALFALAVLWRQARAPHRRGLVLRRFWAAGCAALLLATAVAAWPWPLPFARTVLAGVLVLAVGLPLLVSGMLLEIGAFLAWIGLRRRVPRGMRVPGVGNLMPEDSKRRIWAMQVLASLALVCAAVQPALAALAGTLVALAHAAALCAVWRCCGRQWTDVLQ